MLAASETLLQSNLSNFKAMDLVQMEKFREEWVVTTHLLSLIIQKDREEK